MIAVITERPLVGWDLNYVREKATRAGLLQSDLSFLTLDEVPGAKASVAVPLDEKSLRALTGFSSLDKWHLSPLDALSEFPFRKVIPSYGVVRIKAQWELGLYLELALIRAREEHTTNEYTRKTKNFRLNPSLEETLCILQGISSEPHLSVDIETGRGQINTVGFAWSKHDAVAIGVLPDRCSPAAYFELWSAIARLLESDSRKICQGGIYERLYFARYGIHMRNLWHDTMVAQKFLWPELDKGLDNVGRLYTREPYWKDDGKVVSSEGGKKDWGNVRDWVRHYDYNAKDTSGTYEACFNQREDLRARGQLELFDSYIMPRFPCVEEMCLRGLPLDSELQKKFISEYEARSSEIIKGLSQEINPRSWQQRLKLLKDKGYKIPTSSKKQKDGSRVSKESTDALALKKLRIKHPDDRDLSILLENAKLEKELSSYLRVRTDPLDGNVRFTLALDSTETARWASYTDPWDRGFNAQTTTKKAKKMLRWPLPDRLFLQVDLKQAESRFVAYDSCDANLISALTDPARDIHSEVAAEIFGCSVAQVRAEHKAGDSSKRQLGKKSGHGANYSMAATTFQESCLKELDLVIDKKFAEKTLEAYHALFPGVRRWHARIRETVYRERCLKTPTGRVRYFYGRTNDNTFREAYAYRPQSTVPDIVNHLMLKLRDARTENKFDFWFHLQCHDSLTLSCAPDALESIAAFCLDTTLWHPEIILPAGRLVIPTSIEFGQCLGELQAYGK